MNIRTYRKLRKKYLKLLDEATKWLKEEYLDTMFDTYPEFLLYVLDHSTDNIVRQAALRELKKYIEEGGIV